jgi:hypothetical protein
MGSDISQSLFTGRHALGLPSISLMALCEHVEQCRGPLKGKEILYRESQCERWIRLLHPDQGYINMPDPIPIDMAAGGPKALCAVGEVGDGWITPLQPPESLAQGLATIRPAAQQ